MAYRAITVSGLDEGENDRANEQLANIEAKTPRNLMRKRYYDNKHAVKHVTAVLPPAYQNLGTCLGWSAKAVDMLARRCRVGNFTWSDGDLKDVGFDEFAEQNDLIAEIGQGLTSSLLHATAFIATVAGDTTAGEPDASMHFFDALTATGIHNARTHRLDSSLIVDDRNKDGKVTGFTLHEPGKITTVEKTGNKWEVVDESTHKYGMTVDMLPYRARLGRPFGSSRLSRPMMSIQSMAIRELLRLEGHMDVYSFPELWMLGADLSVFGDNADAMQVRLGRLKGVPDDENEKNPRVDIKQIDASSPAPHLAALNAQAKLFARESGLPDSALAITDLANPTSAEAYDAAQYDLIAEAEGATDGWTPALNRATARALAIKNNDPSLASTLAAQMRPKWRNPKYISRAAEADAGLKQLQALPWLAETDVALDLLGLTDEQYRLAKAQHDRAVAAQRVTDLLRPAAAPEPAPTTE